MRRGFSSVIIGLFHSMWKQDYLIQYLLQNINNGCIAFRRFSMYTGPMSGLTGALEWNRATVNVISNTCAFTATTNSKYVLWKRPVFRGHEVRKIWIFDWSGIIKRVKVCLDSKYYILHLKLLKWCYNLHHDAACPWNHTMIFLKYCFLFAKKKMNRTIYGMVSYY